MSVRDRFMALEQGRSPRPVASMLRQYRTPPFVDPNTGLTISPVPAGARLKPEPPMMRPESPTLSPMMQNIIRQAQMKKAQEAQQAASGMPMPGVLPMSKPTRPASQPSGFMDAFSQPLTSPVGQAISQAAIAGARASDWSTTPVSLGRVLAEMGAAASEGYAGAQDRELKNLLTQAQIAEKMGTAGQAFSGTGMTSQSFNKLLKIGPKIQNKTASPTEIAEYNLAYGYLAKPQVRSSFDEQGNETRTVVPAQDLSQFPAPSGTAAAGQIGASTTKPSPEAIKSQKFVKSMESMALNVNRYRQSLGKLDRFTDMPSGAVGVPTDNMAAATAIAEALRLNLKELYELGALVGGDFQILDNMLTSPNTVKAIKAGPQALMIQLDELERVLEQKLAEKDVELTGTFTMPIDASSEDAWKKVKPGQYAKLPDGRVVMKGASQ